MCESSERTISIMFMLHRYLMIVEIVSITLSRIMSAITQLLCI